MLVVDTTQPSQQPRKEDLEAWLSQTSIPAELPMIESEGRIGAYEIVRHLGRGEFAEVYLGRDFQGEYAIKCINKERVQSAPDVRRRLRSIKRIGTEIAAMKQLRHPSICRFYEAYQSSKNIYIVMELGDRDLYDAVSTAPTGLREDLALHIAMNIGRALAHVSQHQMCHRDVKPENILIKGSLYHTHSVEAKLCDFGLCGVAVNGNFDMSDFVGSPGFFAPEILACDVYNAKKVDVWSLGCILLEMLDGHDKFECDWLRKRYDSQLLHKTAAFLSSLRDGVKDQLSRRMTSLPGIQALLTRSLVIAPLERSSPEDLVVSLPRKVSEDDAEDRLSAATVPLSLDMGDALLPDLGGPHLAIQAATSPCAKRAKVHRFPSTGEGKDDDECKEPDSPPCNRSLGSLSASSLEALPEMSPRSPKRSFFDPPTSSKLPVNLPRTIRGSDAPVVAVVSPHDVPFSPIAKPRISWSLPKSTHK